MRLRLVLTRLAGRQPHQLFLTGAVFRDLKHLGCGLFVERQSLEIARVHRLA